MLNKYTLYVLYKNTIFCYYRASKTNGGSNIVVKPNFHTLEMVIFQILFMIVEQAIKSKEEYQKALGDEKQIVTEIEPLKVFYYAEPDHQQYHVKPGARDYFGLDPLGVEMPKNWRSKL